ncbi:hypothetical protein EDB81DRAFT_859476 [Dactylonectria macrodidyma]|uniref:Fungal-type protein kinase domain-containing protein n=1 Tax=Dactylonectria macrodidyma TaxID=307937 RepID=A0A9P9E5I9_9HYPO|nr:hypothetical protein EDB81DRAFT_859476 [Dactylonectria macrodidyma]
MADQDQSRIIASNPIGKGLDAFRDSFCSICEERSISYSPDTLGQLSQKELQDLAFKLLPTLLALPAVQYLPSKSSGKNLLGDILNLFSTLNADDLDLDRIKALLKAALAEDNTSVIVHSSEIRQDVDPLLKSELGRLYVGVPNLCDAFFGCVPDIQAAAATVFRKCTEGDYPLFSSKGWRGWPAGAKKSDVLAWFGKLIPELESFAGDCNSIPTHRRKLLAQPKTPLRDSTGKRSMDIGFANSDVTHNLESEGDSRYRWSHILVVGELKSNPAADRASGAWIDLATYAREVFAAQDTRRFVLGFTLGGSLMRIWEFDRLGGIASEQFDINKNDGAQQLVTTILRFLWMNEDGLGFDPTIMTSDGKQRIEIERDGQTQRLIIDEAMKRAPCIAGRATTCWKALRLEDPQTPLVIKDSWQHPDRDEAGIIIQEATEKGVANLTRYYHDETARVHDSDDDVQSNIRKGLDITEATNYRPGRLFLPLSASASSVSRKGRSGSAGVKRLSSETDAALSPSKRSCSPSLAKASVDAPSNRVRRGSFLVTMESRSARLCLPR